MKKILLSIGTLSALAGCGGDTQPLLSGQFIDSPVENIRYATSSGLSGTTDANGTFQYAEGDTIKFSLGKIELGEGRASPTVTPIDLVPGATDLAHPDVVKILQVLQTLDDDGTPGNGIRISAAAVARLDARSAVKNIKDITDLTADIISPAFANQAPALKSADAAKQHFADTLGALQVSKQLAASVGVTNFIMGGGNKNCSSFNGDTQSSNCAADWNTIIAKDPAFAGLSKANISFDSNYPNPTFTFSVTQANIDKLNVLPATLFDATRKTTVATALTTRLNAPGNKTALTFAELDGSKPLFADGAAFWNSSTNKDFDLLVNTLCGTPAPANGADCTLSNAAIATLEAATFETSTDRAKVVLIVRSMQTSFGSGAIKYRRDSTGTTVTPNFRAEFQARQLAADGSAVSAGVTTSLTAAEKAVLRSVFVDATPQNNRKFEARTIQFLTDKPTYDMYTQFVVAAKAANGGQTPTIGVVTASADFHPFADRDINVFALKSAGANVVYLPMDGGFRKALDANDCVNAKYYYDTYANTNASADYHNMDLVFPDLAKQQQDFCANGGAALVSTLQGLSGIYFSGGDQAKHLESFVTKDAGGNYTTISPQLALLQARFAAGKLVVGGTSAGDHIQGGGPWKGKPVPMIGGGDSYVALKSGFNRGAGALPGSDLSPVSYAQGGLGFFKYGVLDSHFSRRTREGRLVRETKETGMDYGFGMDENTSLVVSKPDAIGTTQFSVIGAAGVFIVDVRDATASGGPAGNYAIDGAKAHYLSEGDTARIDASGNLSVTLAAIKPIAKVNASQPASLQTKVMDYGSFNFLKLTKTMAQLGAKVGFGTTESSSDGRGDSQNGPFYAVTLTRGDSTMVRALGDRISYTNLSLKLAPCSGTCVAPALP
jgi:cyanophycinase